MTGQITLDDMLTVEHNAVAEQSRAEQSRAEQSRAEQDDSAIDFDFLLQDRIQKIQQIIGKYGEKNFYISFSGGKDSTVLSALIDVALPENTIPRVYANTGIDLNAVRDFVYEKASEDDRIVIIEPTVPIASMLKEEGYPFKSKAHSKWLDMFQRNGRTQSIENYLGTEKRDKNLYRTCPKVLKYQFSSDFNMRVSDKCCVYMKEQPLDNWSKQNHRPYNINGVMRSEGGRREISVCLSFKANKLRFFQPLAPMTTKWENWFIDKYDVRLCKIYYPPYNLPRSGCKGCPFSIRLQEELDMLQEYFPNERKQCEMIWKPVYDEYRRLGYRLKPSEMDGQLCLEDTVCQ